MCLGFPVNLTRIESLKRYRFFLGFLRLAFGIHAAEVFELNSQNLLTDLNKHSY